MIWKYYFVNFAGQPFLSHKELLSIDPRLEKLKKKQRRKSSIGNFVFNEDDWIALSETEEVDDMMDSCMDSNANKVAGSGEWAMKSNWLAFEFDV